jgi:hypothetical protein
MREMLDAFVAHGVTEARAARLTAMIDDKDGAKEFMDIATGYSNSMAFLDHDQIVEHLSNGWSNLVEFYSSEMKVTGRKAKAMEADSKLAGTPAHEKVQKLFNDLERSKRNAMPTVLTYRIAKNFPLAPFNEEKYDPMPEYKELVANAK